MQDNGPTPAKPPGDLAALAIIEAALARDKYGPDFPRVPAAFINAILEEGTKDEAVGYLQKEWNTAGAFRTALAQAAASLRQHAAQLAMVQKYDDLSPGDLAAALAEHADSKLAYDSYGQYPVGHAGWCGQALTLLCEAAEALRQHAAQLATPEPVGKVAELADYLRNWRNSGNVAALTERAADLLERQAAELEIVTRSRNAWEMDAEGYAKNADFWRGTAEAAEADLTRLRAEVERLRAALGQECVEAESNFLGNAWYECFRCGAKADDRSALVHAADCVLAAAPAASGEGK